jgi:Flp pilus assembly protein TadD
LKERTAKDYTIWLVALCLVLLTLVAYWQTFHHDYIAYDDEQYVTMNPYVQWGLTKDSVKWAFTSHDASNWHPLTWMSHMLDCRLFGLSPMGPHAVNLLLHIANTLLLLFVLRRMTKSLWKSAFVAALFALHPMHVESVAWVAERKDVLSTLFLLLTIWAYAKYSEAPSVKRYLPVALLFGLGLLSKPSLVTLPFALLLLDYWPLGRLRKPGALSKLIVEKIPLLALSAAGSVLVFLAQRTDGAMWRSEDLPFLWRASNAAVSYARYLGKMVWPAKLTYFYPLSDYQRLLWPSIAAGVVLVIITTLVARARHKHPYLLTGWLWYIGTLVPVIGLLQIGGQSMADRYTYIPSIGILVMIAWGIPGLIREGEQLPTFNVQRSTPNREPKSPATQYPPNTSLTLLAVVSLAVITASAACTCHQVGYWRDDLSLCRHAVQCDNGNYMAHGTLGIVLAEEGRHREAIREFQQALAAAPDYPLAHAALGSSLLGLGKLREAEGEYRTALKLKPKDAPTLSRLGIVLSMQQKFDEAIPAFRESIRLNPRVPGTYINLGKVYTDRKDYADAVKVYQAALDANPDFASTGGLASHYAALSNSMGTALACTGRTDEAIHRFSEAVRVKPDLAQAHGSLAIAYLMKGDYSQSWSEVHLCQSYGLQMPGGFLRALSQKMPEPGY